MSASIPMKIHPTTPLARLPAYATLGSAGLDLCAVMPGVVEPHSVKRVPTGLRCEIPAGTMGEVRPRSGLASRGIVAITGTIDSDYRGEIAVIIHNTTPYPWSYSHGDRIAQLVIVPVIRVEPVRMGSLSETARGAGGFGSTGR